MDKLMALPKWVLVLIGVVVIGLFGFLLVYFGLGLNNRQAAQEQTAYSVVIDVPEPSVEEYDKSNMQRYDDQRYNRSRRSSDDYWSSLASDEETSRDGSLSSYESGDGEYLDPSVYTRQEIYSITHGYTTKAEVDAEHERARQQSEAYLSSGSRYMSAAQYDSLQRARMDESFRLAAQYSKPKPSASSSSVSKPSKQEEAPQEQKPAEKKLPVQVSPSSAGSFNGYGDDSGIISSLDTPADNGVVHYAGKINSKPIKATFLKSGKIISGERVIIRLMQDLRLSNGMIIPANTHITGMCSFSKRLKIDVSMINYNGRMFPVSLSVYDIDGTEGIYCPAVGDSEKTSKKAKEVISDVVSGTGQVMSSVLTGNPFAGRLVSSGIQQATSSIRDDGTVEVNVLAGYEFYIFENVPEENK